MASSVEDILSAVRSLPPQQQKEVLRRLTESLSNISSSIDLAANDFWASRTIDDLAREQKVAPATDIHSLVLADWPEDESADDIIEYIYAQRRSDQKA